MPRKLSTSPSGDREIEHRLEKLYLRRQLLIDAIRKLEKYQRWQRRQGQLSAVEPARVRVVAA